MRCCRKRTTNVAIGKSCRSRIMLYHKAYQFNTNICAAVIAGLLGRDAVQKYCPMGQYYNLITVWKRVLPIFRKLLGDKSVSVFHTRAICKSASVLLAIPSKNDVRMDGQRMTTVYTLPPCFKYLWAMNDVFPLIRSFSSFNDLPSTACPWWCIQNEK